MRSQPQKLVSSLTVGYCSVSYQQSTTFLVIIWLSVSLPPPHSGADLAGTLQISLSMRMSLKIVRQSAGGSLVSILTGDGEEIVAIVDFRKFSHRFYKISRSVKVSIVSLFL